MGEKGIGCAGPPVLPSESWRDVPGYEGRYEVSDLGRIRNSRSGVVLQPYVANACGHVRVTLYGANGSRWQPWVHRVVLLAWVGDPPDEEHAFALHENDEPDDNTLGNLRWGTRAENYDDYYRNRQIAAARRWGWEEIPF